MIVAGDLGGTKCLLGLFEARQGKLHAVEQRRFATKDFACVEDMVEEFVRPVAGPITAACFGAAGPVAAGRVRFTNVPWEVDGAALARQLGLARVALVNDMEATAYSLDVLEPSDLVALRQGTPASRGTQAIIAAGTGLGEAIVAREGARRVVISTEGGHADFAPRTEEEIEFLRFMKKRHRHVSFELILSGKGFRAIHEFFDPGLRHPSFENPQADAAAPEITELALDGSCPVCVKTVDLWVSLYGAEAGNLALKSLALGGVYVAGGIAVKILDKLKEGRFVRAFSEKAKFGILLATIPIYIVLNQDAPLWGAAARAALESHP